MDQFYPITREDLLNYPALEVEKIRKNYIQKCADYISQQIITSAKKERIAPRFQPTTTCDIMVASIYSQIQWCDVQLDTDGNLPRRNGTRHGFDPVRSNFIDTCLMPSLEIVHARFPDCVLTVTTVTNPKVSAQPYLLIDWT